MRLNEFRAWLSGFEHALRNGCPSAAQWRVVKDQIATLTDAPAEIEGQPLEGDDVDFPGGELIEVDPDTMSNLCGWLHKAIQKNGGVPAESAISPYDGHVIFDLEGHRYVAAIRPIVNKVVAA